MTTAKLNDRGLDTAHARLSHLPAFDGIRGLAVAAVFLFHSQYAWARGGFLGVSAFFTLSGFLITTLLLVERDATGRVDLKQFWSRRARRLLPAAFVALGGILLYGALVADPVQLKDLHGDVISALGYFANWHFIFHGQSYAEIFSGTPSPVLHFWSLAIEEQFYLVFPILAAALLWIGRGRVRVFAAVLVALTFGSIFLSRVLIGPTNEAVSRVYYGTDTRASELLVGALLAVVLIGRRKPARGNARLALGAGGVAAMVALLYLWTHVRREDTWLYRGGFALHAVLVAIVLAEALLPGPLSAFLRVAPLRYLGRISYGIYLYHWPVFLWLSQERLPNASGGQLFVLRAVATLGLATASFYVLERPIRVADNMHRWWPRLVAPVAIAAIVVAAVSVRPPASTPEITFAPISQGPPPHLGGAAANAPGAPVSHVTEPVAKRRALAPNPAATTTSSTLPLLHRPLASARPLRVLVVGDSVGQTFGRGLELWGLHTGRAQVWNDAHFYCSLGRYAQRVYGMATADDNGGNGVCNSWAQRWPQELRQFDPDVVVVLYSFWEFVARKPPNAPRFVIPGDKLYDDWQLGEYLTAADTLSARGAKVVWLTIPCRRGDQPDVTKLIHHLNDVQIARVAELRPNAVRVVDLHHELCPDDQFHMSFGNVAIARPDGAHFSDPGAEAVAGWLMQQILAR
jgi:peptidoglycan/LPS O-acetylase OafA/YrhL